MKSRINSIPSRHHILPAVQRGEINALLSAEPENKGKFPECPAKAAAPGQRNRINWASLHLPTQPLYLPGSNGTLCLLTQTRETRSQPGVCGHTSLQGPSVRASAGARARVRLSAWLNQVPELQNRVWVSCRVHCDPSEDRYCPKAGSFSRCADASVHTEQRYYLFIPFLQRWVLGGNPQR